MTKQSLDTHVQKKEKQMGMTIDQFHQALSSRATPETFAKADYYQQFLTSWLEEGNPIYTRSKERELSLQEGEYFVQCYSPDVPVRNELPLQWFYSNYDNLVSIWTSPTKSKQRVIWLPPKEYDEDNRGSQKWWHPVTGSLKSIKHYTLGALVLHSDEVSDAVKELLDMFGSYAFGPKGQPFNLQAHHELSARQFPERIYDTDLIQLMTVHDHLDLHRQIRENALPQL